MTHLRHANFRELGIALEERFNVHVRRAWVQYSNTKGRVRVCITLFYRSGNYRMLFMDNVLDFSVENIVRFVEEQECSSVNT